MLRYKSIVVGSSEKPLTLMGSDDRPAYSKDGADFSGVDIPAIKDDIINYIQVVDFEIINGYYINRFGAEIEIPQVSCSDYIPRRLGDIITIKMLARQLMNVDL